MDADAGNEAPAYTLPFLPASLPLFRTRERPVRVRARDGQAVDKTRRFVHSIAGLGPGRPILGPGAPLRVARVPFFGAPAVSRSTVHVTFPTLTRVLVVALVALLSASAEAQTRTLPGGRRAEARLAQGTASFYAASLHGRRTASGERYDRHALTAAHRTLPFGTRLRVTNTRNGRSVVVRINDRGPFHGGRVLDLSNAAAAAIGMTRSGTARITYEVLGRGESAEATPRARRRSAPEATPVAPAVEPTPVEAPRPPLADAVTPEPSAVQI